MSEALEIYFDLETTARGPDNSPNAEFSDNEIVMCGYSPYENPKVFTGSDASGLIAMLESFISYDYSVRLVAHNLKFDLKYLLREYPDFPWNKLSYRCTMTEHYLKTGHKDKFPKLEDITNLKKGLDLGALIASGVDVADIPKQELEEYLVDDVTALRGIDYYCETNYILPLAKMELNGLPADEQTLTHEAGVLVGKMDKSINDLKGYMEDAFEWSDGTPLTGSDLKPLAPRSLSYYLTGLPAHGLGGIKDKKHIVFKKGRFPYLPEGLVNSIWRGVKPSETLGYPINKASLEQLVPVSIAAEKYQEAKHLNKMVNTYIIPWLKVAKVTGGTIHPSIHTTSTNTGRLSSSNPNGQNVPPEMRKLVRVKDDQTRAMYEIDFSQLEMIGAATLSGDVQMRADIRNGMDIHFESGKSVFGWRSPLDMRKDERRVVKGVNFGLLYGGGAKGIAENTGADVTTVKKLIESFYARYPDVQAWQENVYANVERMCSTAGIKDGESYRESMISLPTHKGGRRFTFTESESPLWKQHKDGRKFSFKPTEVKNYPIQGFAGGDIVMCALEMLDDILVGTSAVLRMTVHDSIVLEWDKGKHDTIAIAMDEVCKTVQKVLDIPVPLKYDIETANYWV